MTHKLFTLAACAALVAAFPRPASAQSREQRQIMADLRILQAQTQELQNTIARMNQATSEALEALSARLTEQTEATRKSLADQKLTIDAIVNDLRVVRERVDDGNVRVGTLTQEVDALREVVMARSAVAPAPVDGDPAAASPNDPALTPTTPAPAAPTAATLGASPAKMWDTAKGDYWAGQYDLAIMGFEAYAKTFPTGEFADDAYVYIGHSYFQDGKYDLALQAYDAAIRTYPNSDLLPEAYFRKGESQYFLKDTSGARQTWEHVEKTYPDSIAALQARQSLQRLKP